MPDCREKETGLRDQQDLPFRPYAAGKYNEITSFLYLVKMTPFRLEEVMVLLEQLLQRLQGNDQIWTSVLLIFSNLRKSFATVLPLLEKERFNGIVRSLYH